MDPQQQWYRVTVPQGRMYEKAWLLSTLQSACILHFTPVEFHYDYLQARFYLTGTDVANVLRQLNERIKDEEDKPIVLIVESCDPPLSLKKAFEDLYWRDRSPHRPRSPLNGEASPACSQNNSHHRTRRTQPPGWKRDDRLYSDVQWYRVTILQGSWYKRAWLLSVMQSTCSVPFVPVDFHYRGSEARFFVKGKRAADAIQSMSAKFADKDGPLVTFLVKRSPRFKPLNALLGSRQHHTKV